ncbi:hypothetical protein [Hyalangium sp.]|uniref:hypothetical protein n=1 Tax=Hyalangium sp. TaxID=2028555 RepID=UPI002D66EDA0|nr:hypothetical protein [Hyalangium sp.]HYI01549.1 hypothetical protein [Hyalangium sp.]
MPLTVVSLCTYLTRGPWGPDDHTALKFIKALKGTPFNGYAMFPVGSNKMRLVSGDQAAATACFAKVASHHLVQEKMCGESPVRLVPIPSSNAVNGKKFTRFPARNMANLLAAALVDRGVEDVRVADILRWKAPKPASHTGGSRDALMLYQNLLVTEMLDEEASYVLVDDVCTGGGHLRASARRIEKADGSVAFGVCAGRTAQESPDDPLAIITEPLRDLIVPKGW